MDEARRLDAEDPLRDVRAQFHIPLRSQVCRDLSDAEAAKKEECIYLCGNSLGLQPRHTAALIQQELQVWQQSGVHGHFDHAFGRPWVSIDDLVREETRKIVGAAQVSEVGIMNSLTANLHFLLISFYRPTASRWKILIEDNAFPSDAYAVASQVAMHGFDPKEGVIALKARAGEFVLRQEDINKVIQERGEEISLILFSGVQYYTGQLFDMAQITNLGHSKGCIVGFDLAHAVGNVMLHLNEWQVDFAAWCSYKYLNAGPGGIAGIFIHEKHHLSDLVKLNGWWGNRDDTRFKMSNEFDGIPGANGYRLSNPCVMAVVSLLGSLECFKQTSMKVLVEKSRKLTGYLERELSALLSAGDLKNPKFVIITPSDPLERGCQLSLLFNVSVDQVFQKLCKAGVVCDKREPDCIRIAPAPLYNSYADVYLFVQKLRKALE